MEQEQGRADATANVTANPATANHVTATANDATATTAESTARGCSSCTCRRCELRRRLSPIVHALDADGFEIDDVLEAILDVVVAKD